MTVDKALLDKIFANKKPSEHPYFLAIGGGTCTGKGVIANTLKSHGVIDETSSITIDSEAFEDWLPDYKKYKNQRHPEKHPQIIGQYYELREAIIREAVDRKVSVVLDAHINNMDQISREVQYAHDHGYESALLGSIISPADYFAFQRARAKRTGIEPSGTEDGLKWHRAFARNFETLKLMFDSSFLYYYHQDKNKLIHTRIESVKDGVERIEDPESMKILDLVRKINTQASSEEDVQLRTRMADIGKHAQGQWSQLIREQTDDKMHKIIEII